MIFFLIVIILNILNIIISFIKIQRAKNDTLSGAIGTAGNALAIWFNIIVLIPFLITFLILYFNAPKT